MASTETQNSFTLPPMLIKAYIAVMGSWDSGQVRLEEEDKNPQRIQGTIVRYPNTPVETFDYDRQDFTTEFLNHIFTQHSEEIDDLLFGYLPSTKVHPEHIRNHFGIWLSKQLSREQLRSIADDAADDTMHEQLLESLRFQFENYHEELLQSPQALCEKEIRELLERTQHGSIILETMPAEMMLKAVQRHSLKTSEELVREILEELQKKDAESFNFKEIFADLAFSAYQQAVITELQYTLGFRSEDPEIKNGFEAGITSRECAETITKRLTDEENLYSELEVLSDLWARIGENILPLQRIPEVNRDRIIRAAVHKNLSPEEAFLRVLESACNFYPQSSEEDPKDLVYIAESYQQIQQLRTGSDWLHKLPTHNQNQVPLQATFYLINFRLEIVDIRLQLNLNLSLLAEAIPQSIGEKLRQDFQLALAELRPRLKDKDFLSLEQWIQDYGAEYEDEEEDKQLRSIDFTDQSSIEALWKEKRLWTEFDNGLISNELAYVNRFRYLVSSKAHPDPTEKLIYVVPEFDPELVTENHDLQVTVHAQELTGESEELEAKIQSGLNACFDYLHEQFEYTDEIPDPERETLKNLLNQLFEAQASFEALQKRN